MAAADFNDALIRLQQERRLLYISRNKDDVRFADPLMAPFLRSAIFPSLTQRVTPREQLLLFSAEHPIEEGDPPVK